MNATMTKRELLAAERRRVAECDRRAAADMASMDRSNSKPIDPALLAAEPWLNAGGPCGFSWNGWPVTAVRRVVRRRKRR
jgi:hypothetical protein